MMYSDNIQLDETTYYSVLGLPFDTTETQIRKSYMRLARELHPDKSKSKEAAELFKIVAHAHSILTDKEKRLKYDRQLISKGLHKYYPKKGLSSLFDPLDKSNTTPNGGRLPGDIKKPKAVPKCTKPYEEQPYGFGAEDILQRSPYRDKLQTHAPRTKSFNPKGYQNQRNPKTPPKKDEKKSSTFSARFPYSTGTASSKDFPTVNEEFPGKKMPKTDPYDLASPFASPNHRHYARTKFEASRRNTRSTSPLKNMPTSQTESLKGLKDIIDKLAADKDRDKSETNSFSVHQTSQEYTLFPEDLSDFEKRSFDSEDQSPIPTAAATSGGAHVKESVDAQQNKDFSLDELDKNLPKQYEYFNMRNVSDTLDRLHLKRQKLSNDTSSAPPKASRPNRLHESPHDSVKLTDPVNMPIPRVYKLDVIPTQEFEIDLSLPNMQLPPMPSFQCNILNKAEIETCRAQILEFNNRTNQLKRKLVSILARRTQADSLLEERVVRVENMSAYVQAKNYDIEVVSKLYEIQNRQRIVAESFTNLMRSVYATGTFTQTHN
ncbi:HDL373Cp [Eremothecium sinecaudum]|uniref:HDL373Cp n=1 Tax=Eremothecium sinecaudum TaxID=45286 RepID=A0A120K243_9SACH|nr:HDL373Cp [Eremothecium sinecaudum]AMD20371.1 HDL373Cp [Eremothecium sinecaudum]